MIFSGAALSSIEGTRIGSQEIGFLSTLNCDTIKHGFYAGRFRARAARLLAPPFEVSITP
jgi:hypothetical protein